MITNARMNDGFDRDAFMLALADAAEEAVHLRRPLPILQPWTLGQSTDGPTPPTHKPNVVRLERVLAQDNRDTLPIAALRIITPVPP